MWVIHGHGLGRSGVMLGMGGEDEGGSGGGWKMLGLVVWGGDGYCSTGSQWGVVNGGRSCLIWWQGDDVC